MSQKQIEENKALVTKLALEPVSAVENAVVLKARSGYIKIRYDNLHFLHNLRAFLEEHHQIILS